MLTLPKILFAYFAVMILGLAGAAVTRRNPVHAVLLVLAMFLHMAGIYLTLGAEFLAAVQMIVYAGAILVLYLFVVFLVDLRREVQSERFVDWHSNSFLVALLLFLALAYGVGRAQVEVPDATAPAGVLHLGVELFTTYLLPFEIAGIVLLVAVVGGMALARRDRAATTAEEEVR